MDRITQYYSTMEAELQQQIRELKSRFSYLYLVRLVAFIAGAVSLYHYCNRDFPLWLLILTLVFILVFIGLVRVDLRYVAKSRYLEHKLAIVQQELAVMAGDYMERATGEEYAPMNPYLTADFDLVGRGSLFQYLNRSSTRGGEERFMRNICHPPQSQQQIGERAEAIQELAQKMPFVQEFQIYGSYFEEKTGDIETLKQWVNANDRSVRYTQVLSVAVPAMVFLWLLLYLLQLLPLVSFGVVIVLNLALVMFNAKVVDRSHAQLSRMAKIVQKYAQLIALIESENFTSSHLVAQRAELEGQEGRKASVAVKKLSTLLDLFDARYNMFTILVFNPLFGFNLQLYRGLIAWKRAHGSELLRWIEVIIELDSLMGLAIFSHNHATDTTYPTLMADHFCLEAEELGHPLIAASQRVYNSIKIEQSPAVVVVTGANMAGKSTFLRTITTNIILAMNGAPVVARSFRFSPCSILSSIKIQDSLAKNESYFYAEISRLREIVTEVKEGGKTLVVLDEILRGTNTKDKQLGSLGLLKKLMAQNAIVFVATHDLVIGDLAKEYPHIAQNYCFEVELEGDQLVFDYKLKEGVSQKLNASFLLQKMGLIDG